MNEYERAALTVDLSLALLIMAGLYDPPLVAKALRTSLVELDSLGAAYPPARLLLRVNDGAQQIINVLGCLLPDTGGMPEELRAWFKTPNDNIDGATPLELLGTAEYISSVLEGNVPVRLLPVIVFAVANPQPHLRMLDRFLVLCESTGLDAVIVVNKVELSGDAAARELFGNTGSAPVPDTFPMQHPVLTVAVGSFVMLAVFVPLAVSRFRRSSSR